MQTREQIPNSSNYICHGRIWCNNKKNYEYIYLRYDEALLGGGVPGDLRYLLGGGRTNHPRRAAEFPLAAAAAEGGDAERHEEENEHNHRSDDDSDHHP